MAVAVVTGQSMVALLVSASPECPTNVMVFSWAAVRVDPPGPAPTPAVEARNLVPVTVNTEPVVSAPPEREVAVMVGVACEGKGQNVKRVREIESGGGRELSPFCRRPRRNR